MVADAAEGGEFFVVRAFGCAGVVDAPMDALWRTGEDGAVFGGRVADGDDGIEMLGLEFGNGF